MPSRPASSRRSSLGDFVLAGGEIAAMALIEAAVRLIPGVLGAEASPDRGELRQRPARIPAIHPPPELRGPGHPGGANRRKPRGNRQMAAGAGGKPDPKRGVPTSGPPMKSRNARLYAPPSTIRLRLTEIAAMNLLQTARSRADEGRSRRQGAIPHSVPATR